MDESRPSREPAQGSSAQEGDDEDRAGSRAAVQTLDLFDEPGGDAEEHRAERPAPADSLDGEHADSKLDELLAVEVGHDS